MKEAIIGILFVLSLAIVLYFAFTLAGPGSLAVSGPTRIVKVRFPEVTGLKVKNDVLVSGVRKGSVTDFSLEQDGSVVVLCRVERDATLFGDARAEIINISPLGGKAIAINPGSAKEGLLEANGIVQGEYVPDFLSAAGRAMAKLSGPIEDFTAITKDVRDMIVDVKEGKGPVGTLLRDRELAENIRTMMASINEASGSIRTISRDIDTLVTQINSGKGTVSSLIYDEVLAEDVRRAVENVRNSTEDIRELARQLRQISLKATEGDGVVSSLLNDTKLRADLERAVAAADKALAEISGASAQAHVLIKNVNEGKGTAGKLFTDDTLYNDLVRAVNTLQAGFEDVREQAPVTTFASVVFQAFQ